MKSFWAVFFLLVGWWLCCVLVKPVYAFSIPQPQNYVLDQAGVLSVEQEKELEAIIGEIDQSTTVEVGILIVKTLDGEDISQTAFDVGEKWGVGKKDVDNGIMILVAVDDRDYFIATGYGIEGVLPDAIVKRIEETNIPTYFRAGDYAGGLMAVLKDMEGYIAEDDSVRSKYAQGDYYDQDNISSIQVIALVIIIFFIIFKSFFLFSKNGFYWSRFLGLNAMLFFVSFLLLDVIFGIILTGISIFIDLMIWAASLTGGKGGGSGSSGSNWTSSSSGWSGGGSSSSGGSFGGGSFGGGGAGGKW